MRKLSTLALIALILAAVALRESGDAVVSADPGWTIPYTGFEADDEGSAAWNTNGAAPEPEKTGHILAWNPAPGGLVAYYYMASPDYDGIKANSTGALHAGATANWNGFPQTIAALADNGFAPGQLEMKFGLMTLGGDVEGVDWTYDGPTNTEIRHYNGGEWVITLDGEPLVGGAMPTLTMTIDYNDNDDFDDDEISVITAASEVADRSGLGGVAALGASLGVQAVAAAFLADVGNDRIRYRFGSIQPSIQSQIALNGRFGAFFEAQTGQIEIVAGPPPLPSVEIGSITIPQGGSGIVDVIFRDIPPEGLSGYFAILGFDPSVINISGVLGGDSPFDTPPPSGVEDFLDINNGSGNFSAQRLLGTDGPDQGDQRVLRIEIDAVGSQGQSTSLLGVSPIVDAFPNSGGNTWFPDSITGGNVTIGPPETGSILGMKWNDANGNGTKDAGEAGLPGWTIYLDLDNNGSLAASEPTQVTGADGSYSFADIDTGGYIVREVLQNGWTQTFPAEGHYLVDLRAGIVEDGRDFGNQEDPQTGEIHGSKFRDDNANGLWDAGEPGLEGWTIYLDTNQNRQLDAGEPSMPTNADGEYWFMDLPPGDYDVSEVQQPGWWMTSPAEYYVGLSGDTNASGFGLFNYNPNTAELFFDISFFNVATNVTGLHIHFGDANEVNGPVLYDLGAVGGLTSPVKGRVIVVAQTVGGNPLSIEQQLALLGDGGLYVNLHSDAHQGGEIRGQTAWNGYWGPVTVGPGQVWENLNFGNVPPPPDNGSIHGAKWDDKNGDGVWDANEPGLSGWKIYIDMNQDGEWQQGEPWAETMDDDDQTVDDETGMYWIDDVPEGQWKVREVGRPDWVQTYPQNPDYHMVDVVGGTAVDDVDFGNMPEPPDGGSIHGAKWDDRNGNGVWDANEPGLSGWTVYVDMNGDGEWQQGEPWDETMEDDDQTVDDETGMYWIDKVPEGQWMVREVWRPDWVQTYPVNPDYHMVIIEGDSAIDDVNFGNMVEPTGGVCGDVSGDGSVNLLDALTALQISVGWADATPEQLRVGDFDGIDGINVLDVIHLLQYLVGWLDHLDCSSPQPV